MDFHLWSPGEFLLLLQCAHELESLLELLEAEDAEATERETRLRAGASPKTLEANGLLIRNARITDERPALFGRVRLTLSEDHSRPGHFGLFGGRPGSVVRIKDEDETLGIISRTGHGWMAAVFDESLGSDVQKVDLELAPDLVTLQRLKDGLRKCEEAKGLNAKLIDIVFGKAIPRETQLKRLDLLDQELNEDQKEAVLHGIGAPDIALIHGPPGTGKSRTLVEIIRQCAARGDRVLCLTASNAAIDHLARLLLLADEELNLIRLGHPARAHAQLESHTLAGLTERHPSRQLARELVRDALELLKERRSDRGGQAWSQKKENRREANRIFADVRRLEKQATESVMASAQIICGTLTGFERDLEEDSKFDVVIIDEASQVLTPALLLGVLRTHRLVLAGDHRQLPPTVISKKAQEKGLGLTVFEQLMDDEQSSGCRHMLTVQHRMHAALMNFPSKTFYENQLHAHSSVAGQTLMDFGFAEESPLELIDCSGAGLDENRQAEQSSIENSGQAKLLAWRIRELLSKGLKVEQIGVITPYSAQVSQLRNLLSEEVEQGLEIDSVDGFQGREKEVIIFDAVRSNANGEIGFLSDHRRLNVALTRAKRKLIVLGDAATLGGDSVWAELFDHAIKNDAYRSYFELEYASL